MCSSDLTAVMGNCGVGFAPVRPGGEAFLIELMEAIEDIPGTALHEGIDWRWETFGEYIDALAELAAEINQNVENIGARRLHTVLERLLEEISFTAADRGGETIRITDTEVRDQVEDLAKNADLSKFIL